MNSKKVSSKKTVTESFVNKKEDNTGLIFVGFLLLGFGLGFLFNQLPAGIFLGMGVGFLMMYRAQNKSRE